MKALTITSRFTHRVLAMACALFLAVTMVCPAFAAGEGTGTITINVESSGGNTAVTYNAYKIFTADVSESPTDSGTYVATNIDWASTDVQSVVNTYLNAQDSTYATDSTAQVAANYLTAQITNTDNTTRVDATSLANGLAAAISSSTSLSPVVLTSGTTSDAMEEGYYLIVAQSDSLDDGEAGTSPIFTMLGEGQNLEITEKVKVPTLTKAVKTDSDGTAGAYTDAQMGQETEFTLTGTVADNINTYSEYGYTFTDTLPAGMDYVDASVAVMITTGTTETTVAASSYSTNYSSHVLTVDFSDLRNAKDASNNTIALDSSSVVTVTYRVKLNSSASVGVANANTATLTYSSNPNTADTGSTTNATSSVYTFALNLVKVQKDSEGTKLSGAKFTIQATAPDDTDSTDKYVQSDGTLATDSYTFTTDANGAIYVSGLDAGTYTITETEAPSKYEVTPAITLTITPDYENNILSSVDVGLTGGNNDGTESTGTRAAYSDGTITLTVTDVMKSSLPITGLDGITAVYIVGGCLFVVSVAPIVRRRISNK